MKFGTRFACLLLAALAALPLAHCGARRGGGSPLHGQTLFARANLAANRNVVTVVNYRQGVPLPIGTRVTVTGVSPKQISFTVEGGGAAYQFHNHRSSGLDIETAFLEFFGPEDPAAQLAALAEEERDLVVRGLPAVGMSRAAVLLAIGPPPAAKTPNREAPVWTYWNSRVTTFEVHFDAQGTVERLTGHIEGATRIEKPPKPVPEAAPAEILFARCNVRHDEGTVSWANYRGTGPVIGFNTRIEVLKKSQKSVDFRDAGTMYEYEFRNEDDKSGQATWELFLRLFSPEDQAPRLEALAEAERKRVLGNEVKPGMSKAAVEMAWCPPPPHGTASLEAGTWTYWTNRINRVSVHFADDDTVRRIEQ
jgi:hypothetical protein